ncbi:MAG: hypothetical protein NTV58_08855 [Deltaproteobacteria bacterium]|nr:hypothetical protein [Deltaproteobacteria bacterium]
MKSEQMLEEVKSGHWFFDLLMKFAPKPEEVIVTGTPEEMIKEAAKKSFWVSTTLSAVPGPFGLATILPEIGAEAKTLFAEAIEFEDMNGCENSRERCDGDKFDQRRDQS